MNVEVLNYNNCGAADCEKVKELIQNNYNINVKKAEKVKSVYKIETVDKTYCFKVSRYDIKQFAFIIEAILFLYKKGFKGILPIYKTYDEKDYINTEDGYGFLCDWVDSRQVNFNNPVELRLCVETLGDLHTLSRGFNPSGVPRVRDVYGKWIDKFQKRYDELLCFKTHAASLNNPREFDSLYLQYFDAYLKQAYNAIQNLKNSNYEILMKKEKSLGEICHHDTANHNFLITESLDIYLVDFDYCILDTHLHDLASIIIRNLRYGNWNYSNMEFILDNYSKKIPVDENDLYLIYCFMEFPQDFWQIGLQYYVEKQKWTEGNFLRRLKKTTADFKERNEFLKEFYSRVSKDN